MKTPLGTSSCHPSDVGWAASLPEDLVHTILDFLFEPIDHVRFAAVCKLWRSFAKNCNASHRRWLKVLPPMLMFPDSYSTAPWILYSISEGKVYDNINIRCKMPGLDYIMGKRHYGCGNGWLARVDYDRSGPPVLNLINPFKNVVIPLDLCKGCPLFYFVGYKFQKLILSGDPTLGDNSFMVVALYEPGSRLSFTRGGQHFWTLIETYYNSVTDAVFYKDCVYAVENISGAIVSFDVNSCSSGRPQRARIHENTTMRYPGSYDSYLVESTKGELLHVQRYWKTMREWNQLAMPVTDTFKVYRLVFDDYGSIVKQVELETIGDETLFVGDSRSMSVLASRFSCCKPNSIYYTSHLKGYVVNSDMGIFDLEQGTITPIQLPQDYYSCMSQPGMWILPPVDGLP